MADVLSFIPGERAHEHARWLVEQIGPRPAGSAAEKKAHEYVADQLSAWGYQPSWMPVSYASLGFLGGYMLAGFALFLAGWLTPFLPWLTVWVPWIFYLLPAYGRWKVKRRARHGSSQNVFALSPLSDARLDAQPGEADAAEEEKKPVLILCAHVDSARACVFNRQPWRSLYLKSHYVIQRVAVLVTVCSLVVMLGIELPNWLWLLTGILASVCGAWLSISETINEVAHSNRYTPGANDNASGVGVLLTLAEYYAQNPPASFRLGFLFSGAEETGLHGARSFVEAWPLPHRRVAMLNLDMVGAGKSLRVVTREGTLFARATHEGLNDYLRAAYPPLQNLVYTYRSGDFVPFLEAKIPATALQTLGSPAAEMAYHALSDDLSVLEMPALQMTTQAVKQLVELLEARGFSEILSVK